jgi:hypothetical protein
MSHHKWAKKWNGNKRQCGACKRFKRTSAFYRIKAVNSHGKLWSGRCSQCERQRRKTYYASRKDDFRQKARLTESRSRKIAQLKIYEYLLSHSCVDCGETDIIVLEFDHRDGSSKVDNVASMPKHYGWSKIWEEMQKCDVRCAKCHRHRHAEKLKRLSSYEKYLSLKKELYGSSNI